MGRLLMALLLCFCACQPKVQEAVPAEAAGSQADTSARPSARSAHGMTYHDGLQQVILIGGVPHDQDGGVWGWDGMRWQHLGSDAGPGSRGHFALAYDPSKQRLLLHGGLALRFGEDVGEDGRFGDLWAWKEGTWAKVHDASEGPGKRDHHAMIYDPARQEIILFGGGRGAPGNSVLLGDTWRFDGQGWQQYEGAGPPARATHRLAYDTRRARVVLFGGWGDDGLLNDTWEWDGTAWALASEEGPSPRFATRMAYDEARGNIVLFAGRGEEGDFEDTWTWDGTRWQQLEVTGPPTRNVHGMAYDKAREEVVLFGGFHSGERFGDTWTWDGRRWQQAE